MASGPGKAHQSETEISLTAPKDNMIEIDPTGDIIVKVIETVEDDNGEQVPFRTEEFRVRRETLTKASTAWGKMLNSDGYVEGRSTVVQFRGSPILGTEVLLRALHLAEDPITYEASITDVW